MTVFQRALIRVVMEYVTVFSWKRDCKTMPDILLHWETIQQVWILGSHYNDLTGRRID